MNEAAAVLAGADHVLTKEQMTQLIDEIREDERRATVERIRERLRIPKDGFGQLLREVLDEEAAR